MQCARGGTYLDLHDCGEAERGLCFDRGRKLSSRRSVRWLLFAFEFSGQTRLVSGNFGEEVEKFSDSRYGTVGTRR